MSEETMNETVKGKVKWFSNQKGYGFITQDNGKDVFCHFSGIISDGYKSLTEGDEVTFEVTQGVKGEQASNIVVTNSMANVDSEPITGA